MENMALAPAKTHVIKLLTEESILQLSYYTLCKLADFTLYANPHKALPQRIAVGAWKGELTVDELGNFISFR